jgi:hypothetical protein
VTVVSLLLCEISASFRTPIYLSLYRLALGLNDPSHLGGDLCPWALLGPLTTVNLIPHHYSKFPEKNLIGFV